jgi:serine protease inhibitor
VTKIVAANTAPASASTAAPKDFTVDRPFLFYIKKKNCSFDRASGRSDSVDCDVYQLQ